MPYDDPSLMQFENYYLSHKPSECERAELSEVKVAKASHPYPGKSGINYP